MIDHYDWPGGREAMLRFGPSTGPAVIVALPLFEEANRTRTFVVGLLRRLAEKGIGGALPDLPGTGESLAPTEATDLRQMRSAFNAAATHMSEAGRQVHALALRSGALIDSDADIYGRWHFAPQTGPSLLRELQRIRGDRSDADWCSREAVHEIAGNRVSATLLRDIATAMPSDAVARPLRTIRYQTDPESADLKVAGAPLWRRSEPGDDPVLAEQLATDIAHWIGTCDG